MVNQDAILHGDRWCDEKEGVRQVVLSNCMGKKKHVAACCLLISQHALSADDMTIAGNVSP